MIKSDVNGFVAGSDAHAAVDVAVCVELFADDGSHHARSQHREDRLRMLLTFVLLPHFSVVLL